MKEQTQTVSNAIRMEWTHKRL